MRAANRWSWVWVCVALGMGLFARGAAAVPMGYQAQLTIEAASFAPVMALASATAEVAADGSFTLPAAVFNVDQTAMAPHTTTQFFTKASFVFHNGTGMFGGPAQPGGPMPLLGKLKLFAKASLGFPPATLTLTRGFAMATSHATMTFASAMVSNGMTPATLSLYPAQLVGSWLASKVVQSYTAPSGTKTITFGTRTRTGFDHRTSMGVGALNLVIPVYLDRKLNGQFALSAPVTGSLSITFTPEPARIGVEGATVAALVLLGRSRARARVRPAPGA